MMIWSMPGTMLLISFIEAKDCRMPSMKPAATAPVNEPMPPTTDVAIFTGGAIRHTAVLPIAGDQITNDIAAMLRTPTPDAEEIKLRYGVAKRSEERRVGTECVSTCRSRWSPNKYKKI